MLDRIIGWFFPHVRDGAKLDARDAWEIAVPVDSQAFFRSLPSMAPEGSVLVLESTTTPKDLRDELLRRSIEPRLKISPGTLLPTPTLFHLALTQETASWLADTLNQRICTHLYVYNGDQLLLAWWDAPDDPIVVSKAVPEGSVAAFCTSLKTHYRDTSRAA